ncbi:ROK family protein [Flavobacterium branchiicola]|uniref:ROK family protein n=1 Tax=Flavobacterium branchiicola TaxID=1114875 RepID=A0ABV9PL99_9FLAO|nr:ROK family protein [Flavobacterium branchiicola]MBS7256636.1 ROK family protein [Flavobacterium branchiicola]
MSIIIGVDVGGSHISSAAVNGESFRILPETYFGGAVDCMASKEIIIQKWAEIINQTIAVIEEKKLIAENETIGIAFSMPGPFQYESGIAMFKGNNKYEALFNVSISEELLKYLSNKNVICRFLNDASCFGVGSTIQQVPNLEHEKVIAITLGTGFGATFLDDKLPITQGLNVPNNGCLWDKPFEDDIADNYFSTRWFLKEYESASGEIATNGVKEIAGLENPSTAKIFDSFADNLTSFLSPYIISFDADLLVIGGNIAKSYKLFLTKLEENFKSRDIDLTISIVDETEQTSILGSSYLYNDVFWERIKNELPNF